MRFFSNFRYLLPFLCVCFQVSTQIFTESDAIYNETEARVLFELVAAVHNNQPQLCLNSSFKNPEIRPKLIAHLFVRCDYLNSDCTFALFELPAKQIVVAIRGTRTMSQFFFESMSAFIPDTTFHGLGEINFYFSMTHKSIWPKIHEFLMATNYSNHDVIFTGHSLGGSLAALSAFETVLSGIRNSSQVKVVTLAEPRTGNLIFAKNFDRHLRFSFRVINGMDALAHLPPCHKDYRHWPRADLPCDPRSRTGPYHHSTEIWYPDGMNTTSKYITCNGSQGEDMFCSDKVHVTVATLGKGITDHRKYFGKMIGQYGKSNCNPDRTFDENEGFLGKVKVISEMINKVI
ncbi:Fungal lipase-type domain-containing protein [Caenorhabditis elegans]|uniref:Fungal lipase-type domain-containing protein n=1 Tax=Caenorhabditis elegans TaxID=6239 RepID=O45953_CAEEL|nr:Fungal lipase-like domain-containing protein [Caenorhabditis elegans]CAA16389.3 Fungal lipase-like domain-containing protein [Caenorhabditis elegans]|eukprot:NP_507596.3 Uncharacterized protein CELE_Y51A2B.4 [Caenorhabditis elegans]